MKNTDLKPMKAGACIGAIAMAGNEAQADIRDAKIQQLESIEKLQAEDEARAAKQLANLSLQEAEGAQLAARDAQAAKAASITSGMDMMSGLFGDVTKINPVTGEALFPGLGLYGKPKN